MKTAQIFFILSNVLAFSQAGCAPTNPGPQLVAFSTGFEPNEALGCAGGADGEVDCSDDVAAIDGIFFFAEQSDPDWKNWDLESYTNALGINYTGDADPASRSAKLIEDPTEPGNHVLRFQIRDATLESGFNGHLKGRVQSQTNFSPANDEVYARQRVYFHSDFDKLLSYPNPDDWWLGVMIHELRAGSPSQNAAHSFRITLMLTPDFANNVFRLAAVGDKATTANSWEAVWAIADENAAIPTGEWLVFETAFRKGDLNNGRFVLIVTREGAPEPLVVFDVTQWMYSPDAQAPQGLDVWGGPQKLYTSDNVVHHIRDEGGILQAYFDDFTFDSQWPADWTLPEATASVQLP